jgi:hypothetical protein
VQLLSFMCQQVAYSLQQLSAVGVELNISSIKHFAPHLKINGLLFCRCSFWLQ